MDSQYQVVDEKLPRPDNQPGRKWWWEIAIHAICLLWLGPITVLLYLNFSQHIIGPSVWCPLEKCSIYDDYGEQSLAKISRNDQMDHTINGALLFVAKGLEAWFTFVAGRLVYEAQILRDVPSQYSLTYLEFSDLLNILNISKWTLPIRDARRLSKSRRNTSRLCAFAFLACFMGFLVNLMGPATGVLILPSVQSIDQHRNAREQFKQMESHKPPASLSGCSNESLQNQQYSCAEYVQGSELESMTSFAVTPMRYAGPSEETDSIYLAESQEENVRFLAVNFTSSGSEHFENWDEFTVPNRQTLRMLPIDKLGVSDYNSLRSQSMQVSFQWNGPAIAVSNLTSIGGNITSLPIGKNKSVTCLSYLTHQLRDHPAVYTKCVRNGTGWSSMNSQAGFSIRNLSESNADVVVDNKLEALVYFSDKTTYYGGDLNRDAHDVACLTGNSSAPCDWDDIFSPAKVNGSHSFYGSLSNTTIVEWYFPYVDPNYRIWFEFVSHLKFGVYSVDWPIGNEMVFAHLNSEDIEADQLVIDPLWTLAAWSVDINGIVNAARFPTLFQGSNYASDMLDGDHDEELDEFFNLNFFAIAQTMSLITYESHVLNESTVFDKSEGRIFDYWVTRRVWAYGLGTRTSRLGVIVACVGMVTVVFRVIFAVYHSGRNDGFKPLTASA